MTAREKKWMALCRRDRLIKRLVANWRTHNGVRYPPKYLFVDFWTAHIMYYSVINRRKGRGFKVFVMDSRSMRNRNKSWINDKPKLFSQMAPYSAREL